MRFTTKQLEIIREAVDCRADALAGEDGFADHVSECREIVGAIACVLGDGLPAHSLETLNALITYHDRNAEPGGTVAEALEILRAILGVKPWWGEAETPTSHQFKVGDRVVLRRDVERFPHATVVKGSTGTVEVVVEESNEERFCLAVTLDETVAGLEEWDNQLVWDGWSADDDVESLPFDLALLLPCEECNVGVEVGEHCGVNQFLCPDCFTSGSEAAPVTSQSIDQAACPECGGDDDIECGETGRGDGVMWAAMVCGSCSNEWSEIYSLTSIDNFGPALGR